MQMQSPRMQEFFNILSNHNLNPLESTQVNFKENYKFLPPLVKIVGHFLTVPSVSSIYFDDIYFAGSCTEYIIRVSVCFFDRKYLSSHSLYAGLLWLVAQGTTCVRVRNITTRQSRCLFTALTTVGTMRLRPQGE